MQALCACLGRFGNIAATQMPLLVNKTICSVSFHVYVIIYTKKVEPLIVFQAAYWSGLPIVIYGTSTFVAALVTTLVPDTANVSLPDTVRQAEAIDELNGRVLPKRHTDQRTRINSASFN